MFNDIFWILILFPVAWTICMKFVFHVNITFKEWAIQGGLTVLLIVVMSLVWVMGIYSDVSDREVWNGTISEKKMEQKNCPWGWVSYRDNFCEHYDTRSVRVYPDERQCTDVRDSEGRKTGETCVNIPRYEEEYNYRFDWERKWFLRSANLKTSWRVPGVDEQGSMTPPRYAEVSIGDPASITNWYTNWVKAASSSLFHQDGQYQEYYKELIPDYPLNLYDFYKIDRVLPVGVNIPDVQEWNDSLSRILGTLGPERQMNAIIVLVDSTVATIDYAYAVRRAWQGFKKNDAVIFIGLNKQNEIQWSEVLSWSKENAFNVLLRNKILEGRNTIIDRDTVINAINEIGLSSYERLSMKEFEYLKDDIPTPLWVILLTLVFSVGGSIGLTYVFWKYDIA